MIPEIRVNEHGSIAVRDPRRAQPGRPWLVVYVDASDNRHAVFDGQTLPDQAVAGWAPLRRPQVPVPRCVCGPLSSDPEDIDIRPDCPRHGVERAVPVCDAGGCSLNWGHEGAHLARDGRLTRRWREGGVVR